MKSPAVVNYSSEPHSVELREFTRPDPGPDDVILAVEAVGVCGSDLHQWTSSHSWKVNYPVVLGHEFGGVIAANRTVTLKMAENLRDIFTEVIVAPDFAPEALEALGDDRVGGGVAEPQVTLGAEGAAGDGGDLLGLEEAVAEIHILEPEARDVREEVEGRLRRRAHAEPAAR